MADGVELATAWVRLVPSFKGADDAIVQELSGSPALESSGDAAGKQWSTAAKVAMTAGLAVAMKGISSVFETGMDELKFGEQVNAQTDLLVKNTGFAMATDEIGDFTLELSRLSGKSEEELQQAGNNIIKFGDVSAETYKQAVASINDLAASGKDAVGTSEALGKALAEPEKAAALLKRQGVMLNEEQKALIDSFVEAGDKASAQNVILGALEGTYGGMAEATGDTLQGNLDKLGNSWENLAGAAVDALMPAIQGVVGWLETTVTWISDNEGLVQMLAVGLGVLAAAWAAVTAAMWLASATPIALIIGGIVIAVGGLVAAITWLVTNWESVWSTITNIVNGFFSWIGSVVQGFALAWNVIWTGIGTAWTNLWSGFPDVVKGVWNGILSFIEGGINSVIDLLNGMFGGIRDAAGVLGIEIGEIPKVSIPKLALGATVLPRPGGTAAILAEAGRPESVVDTGLMNQALEMGLAGRRGSDQPVNININGQDQDIFLLAKLVALEIQKGVTA